MINIRDFIANNDMVKTFRVNELLFAEFKCPMKEERDCIWWHQNFFFFIASGMTELITPAGQYTFTTGDFGFAKRGSVITQSQTQPDEIFCELMIFLPDEFIKSVIRKYNIPLPYPNPGRESDTIIPLRGNDILSSYFNSLLNYFRLPEPPPEKLLKLKFEELILCLLSDNKYLPLNTYFGEISRTEKPSLSGIMEANFSRCLSIHEYARLSGRSLTAFKTEFQSIFNTSPGRWLREKKLVYSRHLLINTAKNIDQITFDAGFKNSSHFIRIFKDRFGLPPARYRLENHR